MSRKRVRIAVASMTLAMACDNFNVACTLIGCVNALEIKFDRPAAFPYKVELTTSEGAKHIHDCASATFCQATGVAFFNLQPATAIVKVTTPTGTTTTTVQPTYTTSRPNGPNCGPECVAGSATVPISGP
jgi:hypothetical protein